MISRKYDDLPAYEIWLTFFPGWTVLQTKNTRRFRRYTVPLSSRRDLRYTYATMQRANSARLLMLLNGTSNLQTYLLHSSASLSRHRHLLPTFNKVNKKPRIMRDVSAERWQSVTSFTRNSHRDFAVADRRKKCILDTGNILAGQTTALSTRWDWYSVA